MHHSTTNLSAQKRRIWIYCLSVMNSQQALLFSESSWCIPKWVQLWWSGKRRRRCMGRDEMWWDAMHLQRHEMHFARPPITLRRDQESDLHTAQHRQYIQRIRRICLKGKLFKLETGRFLNKTGLCLSVCACICDCVCVSQGGVAVRGQYC